jgi:hypothetical protein
VLAERHASAQQTAHFRFGRCRKGLRLGFRFAFAVTFGFTGAAAVVMTVTVRVMGGGPMGVRPAGGLALCGRCACARVRSGAHYEMVDFAETVRLDDAHAQLLRGHCTHSNSTADHSTAQRTCQSLERRRTEGGE